MKLHYCADNVRYKTMTNKELKSSFVVDDIFESGAIKLCYADIDRAVIGAAMPVDQPIELPTHKELAADYFCERREVGVINIGGSGTVSVDGDSYQMDNRDSLYIARGSQKVVFENQGDDAPAVFYIISYPAHTQYQTKLISPEQANRLARGEQATSNERTICQSIRPGIVDTCQLVMGFTELKQGSVWNTKPPHTHGRRSEIYMYFDFPEEERVMHLMGQPDEVKSIFLAPKQVVISPSWSIHSGVGSVHYTFIWAMGGENQEFDDMDHLQMHQLK